MKYEESPVLELKEQINADFKKEIIAFANTDGGEILVGVARDGSVAGVEDTEAEMEKIGNMIRDGIKPDMTAYTSIERIEGGGKALIRVSVSRGLKRPYHLTDKGLKPTGVFVRHGVSSVPATDEAIRQMLRESDGTAFDKARSVNQELTFETLEAEMEKRHLEFGFMQMKTLKMVGGDGLYTNLALLLSEQCPYTIKAAIFQGCDNAVFRERKEFGGSVLKQLKDAHQFLDFYNKTRAAFLGLERVDQRDYPEEAIREALLNSIIHRDYLFSGSTIINMFDEHVEFNSLGGLVSGLSMDAIMMGVSQSRNPNLAAVFYRLKLVESYGTGIRKMKRLYPKAGYEPVFHTAEGAFSVLLYNRNEGGEPAASAYLKIKRMQDRDNSFEQVKQAVYQFALEQGAVSRKEAEEITGFKSTKAFRLLKEMCEEGKLEQKSNGKFTSYLPKLYG